MKKIRLIKSKKYVIYAKIEFRTERDIIYHKVRCHCHYTGKYRGAAHSVCNLRYEKFL